MLVLGTRGHGGFMGLLLGSVTSHTLDHLRCPTTVVPAA
ncbi:MAG: universal stress protein [Candidatus Microthrix parvicella]